MTEQKRIPFREQPAFQRVYKIGIAIKGFDGLVELVAGLALWLSPSLVHNFLNLIIGETSEHSGRIYQFIAENVGRVDNDFAKTSLVFLIIFLISHGLIKLALVYALLKEILKAYPYALVVLTGFLIYQLYVFIIHPTLGMALFTILDAVIIWLVWGEYQDLLEKTVKKVV
jgi:uncharacterized membrane protein